MDQGGRNVSRTQVSKNDAFSAWFEGEMEHCLEFCEALVAQGDRTREAQLLRARALMRLDRAHEALTVLESLEAAPERTDLEVTRRMLVGAALIRLEAPQRGLDELLRVQALGDCCHATIRAEVALNIGLAQYALRDLEAADDALDDVPTGADVIHARSLEYRGWVASARGDYRTAATFFIAALTRLDACQRYDRFLEVNCLQALAHLAVDALDARLWQTIADRRAAVTKDTSSLRYPKFRLSLSLATFENDVEGRPGEAALEARRAYELAPTAAFRALALCKRAAIARYAHEPIGQLDHLEAAIEEFGAVDAARLSGDERFVALAVAEELANAGRPSDARRHFGRYHAFPSSASVLAASGDPRSEAYEQLVEAQIVEAESHPSEAASLYRRVLERSMTSSVRCALIAAIRLASLTGCSTHLAGFADLATRDVKQSSWLLANLRKVRLAGAVSNLTAVQREHLALICQGYSNAKIAAHRGRSGHTVRNQVANLFEIFGVRSRAELAAEYLRHTSDFGVAADPTALRTRDV